MLILMTHLPRYEGVHIPDIFKTSGIKEASRWKSIDPAGERPYLAMYPLEDLDFLQTDEFKGLTYHPRCRWPRGG